MSITDWHSNGIVLNENVLIETVPNEITAVNEITDVYETTAVIEITDVYETTLATETTAVNETIAVSETTLKLHHQS